MTDKIEPRKEYKLEHFVMSPVHAPIDTPVLFVDHGIRLKGEKFISLAKISDLETLLQQERVRAKVEMMELQNTAWASINDSTGLIAAAIRDNKRYIKRCLAELQASLKEKK